MSYNYSHGNLPKQTQEILRQKKRSEELRKKEINNREETIIEKIIRFLKNEEEPQSQHIIAEKIGHKEPDVLKALNVLTKEDKVKIVICYDKTSNINTPYYTV